MTVKQLQKEITQRASLEGTLLGALAPELVSCDEAGCVLRFPVADWMKNPHNTAHGGIVATMLDTAMGMVAAALSEQLPSTISMTVNYVRPVVLTEPVEVSVRAQHCGRTIAYLSAQASQAGLPRVTATGTFYVASGTDAVTGSAETAEIS